MHHLDGQSVVQYLHAEIHFLRMYTRDGREPFAKQQPCIGQPTLSPLVLDGIAAVESSS